MRRIFAVFLICLFGFMLFLLVYTPAQDFLRRVLGPTIGGTLSGIGASITQSALWQNVITVWPYSFAIGAVMFLLLGWVTAYYWHSGWDWARRKMVHSAYDASGFGGRTIRGKPETTTTSSPDPIQTKTNPELEKTPEPEPNVEDEE